MNFQWLWRSGCSGKQSFWDLPNMGGAQRFEFTSFLLFFKKCDNEFTTFLNLLLNLLSFAKLTKRNSYLFFLLCSTWIPNDYEGRGGPENNRFEMSYSRGFQQKRPSNLLSWKLQKIVNSKSHFSKKKQKKLWIYSFLLELANEIRLFFFSFVLREFPMIVKVGLFRKAIVLRSHIVVNSKFSDLRIYSFFGETWNKS